MNSSSKSQPTVLALLPNWLGDAVMAVPALRSLAARARLVGVGDPSLGELLVDGGVSMSLLAYERRGRDRGWLGLWRTAQRLRDEGAAQCVVFPPSLRAGALAWLGRTQKRTGFGGEGRSPLLTDVRAPLGGVRARHLTDQWLDLVDDDQPAVPRLDVGKAMQAAGARLSLPDSYVVVAPGATYGPTKRWPHFEELLTQLADRGDTSVVVGSSDQVELELGRRLAERPGVVDFTGQTDLLGLAFVLSNAKGFVGNDSGPMHLAAAMGVPTLGIFGSTNPGWTGPRGPRARSIGPAPVNCSPCYRSTCPFELQCLHELTATRVRQALGDLWDGSIEASEART